MVFHHIPVLLHQVLEVLQPRPEGVYLDGTVGGGGHSAAILEKISGRGRLIGLDQDPTALAAAGRNLASFGDRVTLVRSNFRRIGAVVAELGLMGKIDGILLDIGVSSHQLDEAERGFTYRMDAPLDMRMNPESALTAAKLLNEAPEGEIARILRDYGEERWAKRIAQFIVKRRAEQALERTGELVDIIRAAIPAAARQEGGHPAKRTFQALRIAVNDELGALEEALPAALEALAPGGRLAVISFHSLEDRIVKNFFAEQARGCLCPPDFPVCACGNRPKVKIITRKPLVGSDEEMQANPRAQSAKLRAAEKIG
ncbi:16S rRNA (cytosine(1402)-N(4))-methyltransferase RsmH [Heliobacterium undosum]|uniref:Ribosomal RNA small subunit methyltransferase H n=1 Tax=Heliomicrobium undosum TaxID=121734 RepID=A0A845L1U6_9FIRM|nr:16S rRNA (cytosine(1402)-N(4))-methyltransferase RsmH [Heliomicrobium undosum]MZP28955.1 16S rRNA (cytosine(1402)-N(4))-methyltransferase RsmH [Heliomicrobium undosum]